MKELHKRLLALGMGAVMIFAMGAAGCNSGNQGQTPQTPSTGTTTPADPDKDIDEPSVMPDPDKDKEPDDKPANPPVTEKKTLEQAAKEFDAFIQKCVVGKNFTYEQQYSLNNMTVEFAGDKMKMDDDNGVIYLAEENGEQFLITLEDDNAWHKDFADEKLSIDSMLSSLTETFGNITWTAYDEKSNLLIREVSIAQGVPLKSKMEANFDQNDMNIKMEAGKTKAEVKLHKVGTTAVTLPEQVIDDTAEDQYIYTVDENGDYVWNVEAIKEVLEPWLRNEMTDANGNHVDNQFGRPVFSDNQNPKKVRKIVFVNPSKDKLEFGYILDRATGNVFAARYLWGWNNFFAERTAMTKNDFRDFILSLQEKHLVSTISNIDLEYTTIDEDYETVHKQEFETLTKNGFERLATIGIQNDNVLNKGKFVKDFEGAKILFGFKTPNTVTALSPDMGYTQNFWTYYILQKTDGNIEFVNLMFVSKAENSIENVVQNKNNTWRIHKIERKDIAKENSDILSDLIMTIGKETNLSKE